MATRSNGAVMARRSKCEGVGKLGNKGRCVAAGCARRFRGVKMADAVPMHYVSKVEAGQ